MTTRLTIVIVNWNSGLQLRECLASIEAAAAALAPEQTLAEVVVVDNGSSDGSERGLASAAYALRVVRNEANRGFAAACNQGARGCAADLILFLNPDTRLFTNSLAAPMTYLAAQGHGRTGIAGIAMVDDAGVVVPSCAKFPRAVHFLSQALGIDRIWPASGHYLRGPDHAQTRVVDQVIGAFFMIRRTAFDAVNGFDERFFMYFEEVDLSLRARSAGWESVFLGNARAYHRGGGTTDQVRDKRLFYSIRSRLQYGRKHFGAFEIGAAGRRHPVDRTRHPIPAAGGRAAMACGRRTGLGLRTPAQARPGAPSAAAGTSRRCGAAPLIVVAVPVRDKSGVIARLRQHASLHVELGCGARKRDPASIGIDVLDYEGVDLVGDVFDALAMFPDASVARVYSSHFAEHVDDVSRLLTELARVSAPGARLTIVVPHFSNPFYYSDPTHRTAFGLYTMAYYCEQDLFSPGRSALRRAHAVPPRGSGTGVQVASAALPATRIQARRRCPREPVHAAAGVVRGNGVLARPVLRTALRASAPVSAPPWTGKPSPQARPASMAPGPPP